jgi:broad specificity phosphatase PhoE
MPIHLAGEHAGRFVLRHGQSVANTDGIIASSLANARESFGLTPLGREQVRQSVMNGLGSGLLSPNSRVVSSPLLRARESAAIVAEALGATVRVDDRLIERQFGSLELAADAQYGQVWRADREDPSHRQWGVESLVSILERVTALLHELDAGARDETVVLCTHGDVASVLLCAAMGRPLSEHRDRGAMENGELRALAVAPALPASRAVASGRDA